VAILFSAALTHSRGPWLALLITLPIGAVLTRDKKLLATILCVILIGVILFFFIEGFKGSILRPRGVFERLEVWQQILARMKETLFFGKGISADRTFILADGTKLNHSHNVYVGTIFNGGLMGLFLLLILQALVLWEGFLCFIRENDFTYVALLLFAFICMTTMNYRAISHPDALWMYFWLPLALLAAKRLSSDKAVKSFYHNADQKK
jgi:O-antigen ligase